MAEIPSGTKFIGIDASIPTPELNGSRVNSKTQHYTVEDIAAFAGVGSEGPQGVEGPAGPPGPVGPAGLEWQGSWDTDSSYDVDDAVGFNGASWFCISAVTGTGNSNPEEDTESWALLAAQGATGPQGAQGPTGPQGATGPSGTAPAGTQGLVTASTSFPYPVLTNSLNQVLATADNDSRVVLPMSTAVVGQKVVVSCIGGYKLLVKASQVGGGIYINGVNNDLVNEFYIYPNETYEFTYNDNAEWISYFESPNSNIITNTTTSSLSLSTLNSTYASNPIETKVYCPSIVGGGLVYIKTGTSTWVSQPITAIS